MQARTRFPWVFDPRLLTNVLLHHVFGSRMFSAICVSTWGIRPRHVPASVRGRPAPSPERCTGCGRRGRFGSPSRSWVELPPGGLHPVSGGTLRGLPGRRTRAPGRPTPEVRGDHRGLPGRRTWASPAAPRPPHLRPLAPRRSGEPARGYPAVALGASPAATPRQRLPGRRTCAPLHAGRGLQQR